MPTDFASIVEECLKVENRFSRYTVVLTAKCETACIRSGSCLYSSATNPQPNLVIEKLKERTMEWTSPKFEEICLNCEINCYANAEL